MGLFSTLKEMITSKVSYRDTKSRKPASTPTPAPRTTSHVEPPNPTPQQAEAPRKLTSSELAAELDQMESAHAEDLAWRTSIVDLMKLVGMDSSYGERKEMALDLGYSQEDIDSKGSAEMNMWLHQKVMEKLSEDTDGNLASS